MTTDEERADRGTRVRREVLGDAHVDRATASATGFTAPFQDLITRYAWGEIWSRPGLSRAELAAGQDTCGTWPAAVGAGTRRGELDSEHALRRAPAAAEVDLKEPCGCRRDGAETTRHRAIRR
jgi:hypothetical protein